MLILSIVMTLVFSTILCIVEIPKMLKERLYRELWTFSILLGLGTVLAILKSLDIEIPNPSDFIAWVYSPLTGIMEGLLK
ncbi:hypothetical protein GM661_15390 [Iocasia frigidifontis]|uniref:Uncharacterized protein n=1 Tax=Iocasia fonsfrigidae TaxID=2682810 RepID=A0A8A7KDA2_9FIRM|nr:hypothetical protein [Iocasia fonsfrigidae]QTL99240.1 hypothetical protein GM661_15390 [Iocasia fonsfrigidae]